MRKDHRPYFLKKACLNFERFYVRHFLRPHFEYLGNNFTFVRPWHVRIFGSPIFLDSYSNVIASGEAKVRFSVWSLDKGKGRIKIGKYCLICPGVRISSACDISIGDNCMFAHGAFITDADWHGIYNRVSIGSLEPTIIKNNVWVGDSAIVCKGVTIGENSIIGTGSVVTKNVPDNTIAAGNPARVVRELDPNEQIVTRDKWLGDFFSLAKGIDREERYLYRSNTVLHYLRYLLMPRKGD